MALPESGSVNDLARYRIETAKSDLKSAHILFREKEYRGANNRAYYAIYHAISAIHALDGVSYKRHKDTLANFNKDYVRTEIFPKALGRKIAEAEEIRHATATANGCDVELIALGEGLSAGYSGTYYCGRIKLSSSKKRRDKIANRF